MADLKEVKRCGLISMNSSEIALCIHSLKIAQKEAGLEGKKPVTVDGLRQDLIDAYIHVSGEAWTE